MQRRVYTHFVREKERESHTHTSNDRRTIIDTNTQKYGHIDYEAYKDRERLTCIFRLEGMRLDEAARTAIKRYGHRHTLR